MDIFLIKDLPLTGINVKIYKILQLIMINNNYNLNKSSCLKQLAIHLYFCHYEINLFDFIQTRFTNSLQLIQHALNNIFQKNIIGALYLQICFSQIIEYLNLLDSHIQRISIIQQIILFSNNLMIKVKVTSDPIHLVGDQFCKECKQKIERVNLIQNSYLADGLKNIELSASPQQVKYTVEFEVMCQQCDQKIKQNRKDQRQKAAQYDQVNMLRDQQERKLQEYQKQIKDLQELLNFENGADLSLVLEHKSVLCDLSNRIDEIWAKGSQSQQFQELVCQLRRPFCKVVDHLMALTKENFEQILQNLDQQVKSDISFSEEKVKRLLEVQKEIMKTYESELQNGTLLENSVQKMLSEQIQSFKIEEKKELCERLELVKKQICHKFIV